MTTTSISRRLRVAGATTAVALATVGAGIALAAPSKSSSTTSASTGRPLSPPAPGQEDARLAKALGISEAKVKAARAQVRSDELAAAVKSGRLTSRQQQLIEELRATGLDVPLPPGVKGRPGAGTDPKQALADALGVSVEKLHSARPKPPAGGPRGGGPPAPPAGGPAGGPAGRTTGQAGPKAKGKKAKGKTP